MASTKLAAWALLLSLASLLALASAMRVPAMILGASRLSSTYKPAPLRADSGSYLMPTWGQRRRLRQTDGGNVGTATAIAEAYGPVTYTDTYTDVNVTPNKIKVKATAESYAAGDGWHEKAKAKAKATYNGEDGYADVLVYTSASEDGSVAYKSKTVSP